MMTCAVPPGRDDAPAKILSLANRVLQKAESNYVRIFLKDQGLVVMAKTVKPFL